MGGHFRSMLTTAKYLNIGGINTYVGLPISLKKYNQDEINEIFPYKKIIWLPKNHFLPNEIHLTIYLNRFIKRNKIDIIHSFCIGSHIISYFLKILHKNNLKICATICGGTVGHKYPFCYPLIVYSDELRQIMSDNFQFDKDQIIVEKARMDVELYERKTHTFNNLELIPKKRNTKKKILFITRFSSTKINALYILFRAVIELSKKRKDFQLILVAHSESNKILSIIENKILKINKEIGYDIIIHQKNWRSYSKNLYKNFDIVAGVARVCFEGMMNAKPTILIGNNGFSGIINVKNKEHFAKIIRTNFSSRDLKPKKNIKEISNALEYIFNNPEIMHQYGIDGEKWVKQNMDAKILIETYRNIYENLLEVKKQRTLPFYNVFYSMILRWIGIIHNPIRSFISIYMKLKKI
tara:strand:- start:1223 stop:2452 length:1230 start_codon:yes stop_codon:yes gene_type:complete